MPQIARPIDDDYTDVAPDDEWNPTPWWSQIDGETYDDSSYVSCTNPIPPQSFECLLSPLQAPHSFHHSHSLSAGVKIRNAAPIPAFGHITLYQGSTPIATSPRITWPFSFENYTPSLTQTQIESITNFADSRIVVNFGY